MSSETITRNDLTNILNEIVAIDGTDMTAQEISDFVDSLNVTGIHAVDYVVEQGTSGSWTYTKWNSGKYEASINTQFALNAGTSWIGGYWHKTTYGAPLPSFALTWSVVSAVKTDDILAWYVGAKEESDGIHFYWLNGSSGAVNGTQFGYAEITIKGTWK